VTPEWRARPAPSNPATLVFFRPYDAVGSALAARILMDGYVVGAVGIGDRLSLSVAAGRHVTGLAAAPITVELAEGETLHYLVQLTPWTQMWNIQRLTEAQAALWMQQSREVGASVLPSSELLAAEPERR
jgi:hypothetical protein